MCGIAGILQLSSTYKDLSSVIKKMTADQQHRGPDAEGFYHHTSIFLGHRRLSIIDLSKEAKQPMQDVSGRYVIIFNGEIYNYRQIKSKLRNYSFKSNSDTEVILAAFSEWKEDCLQVLKGQFAFAIWDTKKEKLFFARDRMGEKPFYYYLNNEYFVFASEIRSLLNTGIIPKQISQIGIVDFFMNQSVQAPNTIVEGIFQLPAAHFGWMEQGTLRLKKYWDILSYNPEIQHKDYSAICKNIRDLLHTVIDGQMISDVPLGAFLSGGIDSSAIVGLMAEHSSQRVNTISITFDDKKFDESKYSSLISRRFNTYHHEIHLKPHYFIDEIANYFQSIDVPSEDGPNIYIVSKEAKKVGLTVALSGVGGDELFAGYRYFKWYYKFISYNYFWYLPVSFRKQFLPFLRLLRDKVNINKLQNFLTIRKSDASAFYALVRSSFLKREILKILSEKSELFNESVIENFSQFDNKKFSVLPILSQFTVLELTNYTQNVLLKDTDNMAMANSLEVRVPFCDYDLINYVISVPDKYKYPHRPKKLLTDSLEGLLPNEIIDRPKMGFSFPWKGWLQNELNSFCDESIKSLSKRELFKEAEVNNLWQAFQKNNQSVRWNHIWSIVTLEQWLRKIGI